MIFFWRRRKQEEERRGQDELRCLTGTTHDWLSEVSKACVYMRRLLGIIVAEGVNQP